MKRYYFVALATLVAVLCLMLVSCAEIDESGLEYASFGDGTCEISGIGICTKKSLLIPQYAPNGDRVVGIRENALNGAFLTGIEFQDGIEYIGNQASSAVSDAVIMLPNSLNRLDSYYDAYSESWLQSAQKVSYMGGEYLGSKENPYLALVGLVSPYLPELVIHEDTKIITGDALEHASFLEKISIPNGITYIAADAFVECEKLKYNIVNGIKCLGNEENESLVLVRWDSTQASLPTDGKTKIIMAKAFYNMSFFGQMLEIPSGVEYIGKHAFSGQDMKKIVLNSELKYIDSYAFYNCLQLEEVQLNEGLETIGEKAFYAAKIKEISFPKSIKRVEKTAFEACLALEKAAVGANLNLISEMCKIYDNIKIYFYGDQAGWEEALAEAKGRYELDNESIYFYSKQPPQTHGNYWHYSNGKITEW